MARAYSVRGNEIRVRYEPDYPGHAPGCEGQTEAEDVFRSSPENGTLVRRTSRQLNGWHRELRATVAQLFDALAARDEASLAKLVPDVHVRRRLPSTLAARRRVRRRRLRRQPAVGVGGGDGRRTRPGR